MNGPTPMQVAIAKIRATFPPQFPATCDCRGPKAVGVLLSHLDAGQQPLEAIATAHANQQISGGRMRELIEWWLAGADVMSQLPDEWETPDEKP